MSFNLEQFNSGYVSLSAAGVAAGTTASQLKTVNTLVYTSNAVFKSNAATAAINFSAGHTALAVGQACLFGLWIDSAGTFSTSQGPIVNSGDPCPVPPAPAANLTLAGLAKVTASSAVFTPGTTLLGTGNTASYLDCMVMPGSAQ